MTTKYWHSPASKMERGEIFFTVFYEHIAIEAEAHSRGHFNCDCSRKTTGKIHRKDHNNYLVFTRVRMWVQHTEQIETVVLSSQNFQKYSSLSR